MGKVITLKPVTPSVAPASGDTLIGSCCDGLIKVYASKERVSIMFADPREPGNPERRQAIRLMRTDAITLATMIREAGLTIR